MKKTISIIVILCTMATLLVGCWPGSQEEPALQLPVYSPGTPAALEDGVIIREELEDALAEVAWDYYIKAEKVQYDSMDLNTRADGSNKPLSKYSGGFWRTTTNSTLEDADSDTPIYTVCSDYAWTVYYEALGYPILGNRLNCHTSQFWRGTEYPDDMVVLRWSNKGKGTYLDTTYDDKYGMTFEDWYELEDVKNFLLNWQENLRPGDIITQRRGNSAHTVLYVGNGMILHSNGDGKYNMVKGTDKPEPTGSVGLNFVEDYWFKPGNIFNLDAMVDPASNAWICVVRPLDILTKDDEDDDPANDVLDETYVLNTGKLNAQLSIDPKVLQTTGYTIKNTTYTRMAYPGMDIDRTVDITPYGTVAKGDTLTYSIAITNKSSNPQYATYRSYGASKLYVGENYKDLIITEHVPANAELVSAPGAMIEGNTLCWQVDVPRGKTVVLTYTVKATGNIGEKIVNNGGFVADIPSNSITNVIGGTKLSDKALAALKAFAAAEKAEWNSNDGYKIPASKTTGTAFAERIYSATTGLDLQLPDVQELMDIIFSYGKINVKNGLYLAHGTGPDSPGTTRYMYTLNKTAADPANQVYCDMVVDGYFGGVWAFSNDYAGESRIYEFRVDYMEPGDIVVHANLNESLTDGATEEVRKVEKWNIVVYLGDGVFASLDSDGKLKKVTDDSAIMPGFTYDLFVALRPSQAYANINSEIAAVSGSAPDLTDEDKAWAYNPELSDVLLSDAKIAELAALTANGFEKIRGEFVGEVYSKIGLDVVTNGTMNSSYATIVKAIFEDIPSDLEGEAYLEYGHEYYLLEYPFVGTEKIYDMLMYYGGPAFGATKPITSLADLYPGDVVMLGRCDSDRENVTNGDAVVYNPNKVDVVAVYQGNGKFLVNIRDLAGTYYGTADYREWKTLSFDNAKFKEWLSGPIVSGNSDLFEGYLVLRPSRVFDDINTKAYIGGTTIVPDGSKIEGSHSITDRLLNNAEKELLANLSVADWLAEEIAPTNLVKIPAWIYGKMLNVNDITNYFDNTMFYLRNGLFYKTGSWYHLSDPSRANHVEKYHQMLVPNRYGGFNFETSRILKESDFEIGDLFCAWTADETGKNIYWVGLYQGDYRFLLIRNGGYAGIKVCEEVYLTEFNAKISKGDEFAFYFILRPEQLAGSAKVRDINDGELTAEEKQGLANITVEDWEAGGKKTNNGAATWFYNEVNINIAGNFDKSVFNLMYAIFSEETWAPNGPDHANYEKYAKMLVDGYYGGGKFGNTGKTFKADGSDFEIGDLFCAYTEEIVDGAKKRAYYVGLYQGNGNFLMTQIGYGVTTGAFVDNKMVYAEDIADIYMCYYIIRPNQLNAETPAAEPRDIATGLLTDAEKAKLSGITEKQYNAAGTEAANQKIAVWAYKEAGIDISAYLDKSVFNLMKAIFVTDDDLGRTPILKGETGYNANYSKMLVEGFYGGTEVNATDKLFTAADFQVGDLFCGVYYPDSSSDAKNYYAGLYLGDGKFLMSNNAGGWHATIDSELVFKSTLADELAIYYVLRPEQLALPDAPDGGTTEPDPSEPTTPSEPTPSEPVNGLTEAQKEMIAAITVDDLAAAKKTNDTGVVKWFCQQVGMTSADVKSFSSIVSISTSLFNKNDGADWTVKTMDPTIKYHVLFVEGYYGGLKFGANSGKTTFTASDFEIGDIFCAQGTDSNRFVGLYQGNGQFLMYNYNAQTNTVNTTLAFDANLATSYNYYFVLRPAQFLFPAN